ncbi:hypothetical protein H2200_007741 [Cladophialophora chaetospira]|uniref:Uncharacterized protein n=1 Tax=Cladophialophora chaetospira TaxID=386627 RepID=A0AA39CGW0_9EURO|nr:hypothetical protein H2200_007741 [Cladophialophora chaetospira]
MTRFHWNSITSHSEAAPTTQQQQATEIPLNHHRHSKLSHVMDSIRLPLAHEHERLPMDTATEQPPAHQQATMSSSNGSISPALQAVASLKLNENNMGEDSHQNSKTWGWPGLGTFLSHDSATSQKSKRRTESTGSESAVSEAHLEKRMEAATFEAIDNAAELEAFGWPGLGYWSPPPKK